MQGNSECNFFMWKPASTADAMEAATMKMVAAVEELKARLREMQDSLGMLTAGMAAQRVEMRRNLAARDRNTVVLRWLIVVAIAALAVNLVLLAVMAMK